MTKHDDEDDKKVLKDSERLRVPMFAMDSQKALSHKPGYRVGQQLLTDSATRETLADAYEEYENQLVNAWRNAAPGPVVEDADPVDPIITADAREQAYAEYDRRTANAWKGGRDV